MNRLSPHEELEADRVSDEQYKSQGVEFGLS